MHGGVEAQRSCVLMMEVVHLLGLPLEIGHAGVDKRVTTFLPPPDAWLIREQG